MKALLRKIREMLKDRRNRRLFTQIVSFTAAIVVFVTTYALVLPAITMETEANCGIPAHQHDDSCYEEELICGQAEDPGHHHTDACYTTLTSLICTEQEHQHDDSCYDAEGNLICELSEHTHDDSCYEETRELTCGFEESDGHQHTDACYERVLTCGLEAHTHSAACYSHASEGEAGGSGASSEDYAVVAATTEAAGERVSMPTDDGGDNIAVDAADTGLSSLPAVEDAYVPELEPLFFDQILTQKTGIYYFHPEEGKTIPENSVDITEWTRANDDTELAPTDILRVYLRYTIPAGSLNSTNPVARYRLPSNLHLTDEQMETINTNVNGIANQYVNLDTLEILDPDQYNQYLGIEAVEGTRTPADDINEYFDKHPDMNRQEYISATVQAENVYDTEGLYGEKDAYLGQDLIFTFTPYTVQKNQHEYDADGQPTKAGEKVNGWLCFDVQMDQIDWGEPVVTTETVEEAEETAADTGIDTDADKTSGTDLSADTAANVDEVSDTDANMEQETESAPVHQNVIELKESNAEILFAAEDKSLKIDEISTNLRMIERTEVTSEEDADKDQDEDTAVTEENGGESDLTTVSSEEDTENPDQTVPDEADGTDKVDESGDEDTATETDSAIEINAETYPAVSFEDSIVVRAGSLSTDNETAAKDTPEETTIIVSVAAEPETFPLGTTMVLGAVDDMDTVASAVEGAVEGQTRGFHAVDISFHNADGEEIEPLKPIRVSMTSEAIKQAVEDSSTVPVVMHVENPADSAMADNVVSDSVTGDNAAADAATADPAATDSASKDDVTKDAAKTDAVSNEADSATDMTDPESASHAEDNASADGSSADSSVRSSAPSQAESNTSAPTATIVETNETTSTENSADKKETADTLSFDAGSFSVYAIVYTVDFHWEVNGNEYSFSIPGGGYVSFQKLIEIIGAAGSDTQEQPADHSEDSQEGESETGDKVLTLDDVVVSDAARAFVSEVESVEFSSPELVWVGKVDEATSVGALKEANKLECEYSAELTEEQIKTINDTEVESGDWALISVQPFTSEESLTVTMKNGDRFVIRVTDRAYGNADRANVTVPNLNGLMTVNMFNYGPSSALDTMYNSYDHGHSVSNEGINSYSSLKFVGYGTKKGDGGVGYNAFTGGTSVYQGIVNSTLPADGYPTLADGGTSLDYLFDGSPREYGGNATGAKSVDSNVQGLFYKANSDGSANASGSYYAYDSDRYYAYLNGSNVELYNTYKFNSQNYYGGNGIDPSVSGDGFSNKGIGFFPYTAPNDSNVCPHPRDVNWHNNWHNELRGKYDHQFGLSMSAQFEMPLPDENGKQKVDGNDMIFSFSGDDDMWVFIDDVLVLDIGGVHHPSSGYINFTEGFVHLDNAVYGDSPSTSINKNSATVNIADIFAKVPDKEWVTDGHSAHTIKVFYLERGGIYSNCKITFNLPLVLGKGNAEIVKKDADPNNTVNGGKLEGAIFGLWKTPDCSGEPFMTRVSGQNGMCTFSDLSVGDDLSNLVFYMKEMRAPAGYKLDTKNIYQMKLVPDSSDVSGYKRDVAGNYIFQLLNQDGTSLHILEQEPKLPYIENEKAEDIGLKVQKKWQNADNVDEYADPPAGVKAKFRIKRYRSYNVLELGQDGIYHIIDGKKELDIDFNRNPDNVIELPIQGSQTPWDYTFSNLKTTEPGVISLVGHSYDVQFYYEYFIEEEETPEGYETIYLNDEGKEIPETSVKDLATDDPDQSQTIINRELLDVPATKYWPDYSGVQYDWTAGFQLEYMEVKVNNTDEDADDAVTEFTPIEGKYLTISKNTDPSDAVFGDLPMYKEHSNGTRYRILYSVREMSYEVKNNSDDSVVIQWYRDGSKPTIGLRYTPQFEQDAGEHGAAVGDYEIILINTLENRTATKEIDLDITKTWPTGALTGVDNPFAKFVLKRYVHEEYVDFSNVPIDATWVDITLDTGNGATQTIHVPQGWTMHIEGNIKGSTNADSIMFNQSVGEPIEYSYDNSASKSQHAFSIEFTADQTKTITLTDGAAFAAGGADGFRLTEMNNQNTKHIDSGFAEELTLNNGNEWHEMISHLSAIEEDDHAENATNITRHVYEYFLVESGSNPADYYATFKASDGSTYYLSGDEENVIDFTTSLTAENKLKPGALKVSKVVKVDGSAPTPDNARFTNGTYTFKVLEADGVTPARTADGDAIGDIVITFANGVVTSPAQGYALVGNLEPGNYVLKEVLIPDGMTLTGAKRGDAEAAAADVEAQTINVVVKAGDTAAADAKAQGEFTNNINLGKLQIRKEVTYNGRTPDAAHKSELAGRFTFKIFTDAALQKPYKENGIEKTISLTIGEDGEAEESDIITVPAGTYWIQETESTNPYTFPVENPIEVTVEQGATLKETAIKTFTNNKDVNENPDKITIDIQKKFTGLLSKDHIPANFQVSLQYKVGLNTVTVPLKNVALYTEGDTHVRWNESEDGFTWSWHVSNIDASATDFSIKEDNYSETEGYTFSGAKLDNSDWETPDTYTGLSVTAPTAELEDITSSKRYTPDPQNSFVVNGNDVLLISLTANAGTLAVSDRSLNKLEREAISNKIPFDQGSFAQPVTFFSIEEHPNEFYFHKGWIKIEQKDGIGNVVTIEPKQSSQKLVFKVTYNNQDTFNNATVENNYTQANIELDVVKADKNSDEKLSGAVFTLKEIDETKVPTEGGIPVYKQDDNGIISRDSAPTAETTGLTKFDNLTAGYYEITESKAPDGYIKSTDTAIYFKVQRGKVIWLTKDKAKQPSQWAAVPADNENEWITFVQADATLETNAKYIVNNEPGAALPHTGGPGTRLFTILGSILILGTGVLLWSRRRLI